MEFCQGGELFERIVAKTTYNEKEARDVIRMLLSALAFCHDEAKVVHRDLKVGRPFLPYPSSLAPSLPPFLNSLITMKLGQRLVSCIGIWKRGR